jgi:hypothetical protein
VSSSKQKTELKNLLQIPLTVIHSIINTNNVKRTKLANQRLTSNPKNSYFSSRISAQKSNISQAAIAVCFFSREIFDTIHQAT